VTSPALDQLAGRVQAAARLVAENRALRALLQRGGDALAPEAAEEDLRISALTAANDRLRGQLIALHARIEQAEGPAARDLERAIWAFLRASVAARPSASTCGTGQRA